MHDYLKSVLLGIPLEDEYWKMYAVVIQLGAILSVLVYFRPRIVEFLRSFPRGRDGKRTVITHPASLVLLAFAVTAGPAFLADEKIGDNLESELIIALALLIGGIVMWIVDVWAGRREAAARAAAGAPQLAAGDVAHAPQTAGKEFEATTARLDYASQQPDDASQTTGPITWTIDAVKPLQAIAIGAAQILAAAFPGTSRSMSTIAAGQLMGLSRPAALEFSFFLSIPVMVAATGLKLAQAANKARKNELVFTLDAHHLTTLAIGMIVSFVVALLVIHWFMAWVRNRGFVPFAIYRIVAGTALLAWIFVKG